MTEPRAYYNEHDPSAVAWLKELMSENLIAPGEIDDRSIEDVEPADLEGFTQCHFFAGIGVWSYSLRAAGWSDDLAVWTGSCPCQPFSASGQGEGFSDKRHLWPAWFRLISKRKPFCIFGEQVASKAGLAWFDIVSSELEGAGYAIGATDRERPSVALSGFPVECPASVLRGVAHDAVCECKLSGLPRCAPAHSASSARGVAQAAVLVSDELNVLLSRVTLFASSTIGVGHEVESLSDVRRADARSAKMGLPDAWHFCGERAMRLLRQSRKRSSKPTSK